MLPRTIDKLRALPRAAISGHYLNDDIGFSAYVVRRLGLEMTILTRWRRGGRRTGGDGVAGRARGSGVRACALDVKLETLSRANEARGSASIRQRHPAMAQRPELTKILDVLEARRRPRASS